MKEGSEGEHRVERHPPIVGQRKPVGKAGPAPLLEGCSLVEPKTSLLHISALPVE